MKIALMAHAGSVHTRRWLAGLASRGHEIEVFTNSSAFGFPEKVTVHLYSGRTALSYFRHLPKVKKAVRRYAPDVVHAHYATGYGLWGSVQKTAPLIVSVWGTDIAEALSGKIIITPIVRRALKTARFVTSSSKFMADQVLQFEPSVRDKLVHIPFGVPADEERRSPARETDTVRIIFAKQFFPVYAPDLVIRAFAEAARRVSNIRLLMIGGGELQGRLQKMAEELGVQSLIELRGWVEMAEARRLIRESDIMIMPSYRESFGVAALEATAAGVPVIATNTGGIPEIIENDYNGILISPGDEPALTEAIVRLADDPLLRGRMGEAGRKIARERFDFEDCLDRMEELYRKAAGG